MDPLSKYPPPVVQDLSCGSSVMNSRQLGRGHFRLCEITNRLSDIAMETAVAVADRFHCRYLMLVFAVAAEMTASAIRGTGMTEVLFSLKHPGVHSHRNFGAKKVRE